VFVSKGLDESKCFELGRGWGREAGGRRVHFLAEECDTSEIEDDMAVFIEEEGSLVVIWPVDLEKGRSKE